LGVPGAQCFIKSESCRVELEQLLKACIQYVFSLPVVIERCCGINANHAQNCQLTDSDPDLETRVPVLLTSILTAGSRHF
jgi:hypothetical protein